MTERRSDGVGARSVAPGLPPTSNDGIEGKTATAHKARKMWNGLIQGRGVVRVVEVVVGGVVGSA